jgi:hypothetical protein
MEWHKWWDPNLSNVNIRQILLKNNFIIFDFDQRLNAFASMIYAIKN